MNSSSPSARHFTKSPVRYNRAPAVSLNGCGTNRSAVSSARPRYPRASPAPPRYNSPTTPTAAGSSRPFSTYVCVFAIARPIGTIPAQLLSARTSYTLLPTTVSVGPYSLISRVPAACSRHPRTVSLPSASPPITSTRALAPNSAALNCWFSTSKCDGVNFTSPNGPCSRRLATNPSTPTVSGTSTTLCPTSSGDHRLVILRSKLIDECSGAP